MYKFIEDIKYWIAWRKWLIYNAKVLIRNGEPSVTTGTIFFINSKLLHKLVITYNIVSIYYKPWIYVKGLIK